MIEIQFKSMFVLVCLTPLSIIVQLYEAVSSNNLWVHGLCLKVL